MFPCRRPNLLQLPFEIRRHIFEAVIDLPAVDHISLLCVCKQVHQECNDYFFRRPLVCGSQTELVAFTNKYPSAFLERIENLQIRLEELDPTVMQPFLAQCVMGISVKAHFHPYYQEGQRIIAGLQRLPNLRQLSILPPRDHTRSASSGAVLGYVMAWAEKHYPQLERLLLSNETVTFSHLSGFQQLRSLQCSGFSLSSSETSVQQLSKLRHLRELFLIGPPEGLRRRQSHGYDLKIIQSITPDVIRKLNPLRNFTLCELSDARSESPAFLTKGLLKALYGTHRQSLQELHLTSTTTPDAQVQKFIVAFLMSTTNIRSLTFGWQQIDVEFLDCVPYTTQQLEVVVHSSVHAQAIMDRLMMIQYRLPCLRKVIFNLINLVQQMIPMDEKGEVGFAMPMQSIFTVPFESHGTFPGAYGNH